MLAMVRQASRRLISRPCSPLFADGGLFFFGCTQATTFTDVFLTVTDIDEAFGVDKLYFSAAPNGRA